MSDILSCQGVIGGRLCGYLPQADPRERRGSKLYMTEKGGMCAPCYNLHGNGKVIDQVLREGRQDFWADGERRKGERNESIARPHIIPGPGPMGSDHFHHTAGGSTICGAEIYRLSIRGLTLGAVCLAVGCPTEGATK